MVIHTLTRNLNLIKIEGIILFVLIVNRYNSLNYVLQDCTSLYFCMSLFVQDK